MFESFLCNAVATARDDNAECIYISGDQPMGPALTKAQLLPTVKGRPLLHHYKVTRNDVRGQGHRLNRLVASTQHQSIVMVTWLTKTQNSYLHRWHLHQTTNNSTSNCLTACSLA